MNLSRWRDVNTLFHSLLEPERQLYFEQIGYRLRSVQIQHADWDEDFYRRFEDVLGRIPRSDLRRDYFTAVLEKPVDA